MNIKKYAIILAFLYAEVAVANQINLNNAYGVQKKIATTTNEEEPVDPSLVQNFDDEDIIEMETLGEIDMKELAPNALLAWANEHIIAHFFVLYNWLRHRYEAFKVSAR